MLDHIGTCNIQVFGAWSVEYMPLLYILLGALAVVCIFLTAWNRVLRAEIDLRTRDLADDIEAGHEARLVIQDCVRSRDRLVSGIPAVFFRYNPILDQFEYVSEACADITGYDALDFYNNPKIILEITVEEDQPAVFRYWEAVISGKESTGLEYAIQRQSGEKAWICQKCWTITDEDDVVIVVEGLITETSYRHEAEEALRRSEERWRNYFELPMIGVGILNRSGEWLAINSRFCAILGYEKAELIQKDWIDLVVADELESGQQLIDHIRSGDIDLFNQETRFRAHNSQELYINLVVQAMKSEDGGLDYYVAVIDDITDRKLMEKALRDSQERMAYIIDFLPDATLAIDLEGRIITWNRAMEAMTGIEASAMIGRGNYEYALPFYGEKRPILVDLVFRSHEEIEQKYSFIHRIGDTLYTETTVPKVKGIPRVLAGKASPLYDSNGQIIGAIESIRDMTERYAADDALKQSRRTLEELNRQLEEIIEFLPDATLVIDKNCRVIAWNRALEKMTGIPKAAILGKGDHEYSIPFYGTRKPMLVDLVQDSKTNYADFFDEFTVMDNIVIVETFTPGLYGGRGAYLQGISSPLYDLSGNINGAIECIRDITEKKKAEAIRRQDEARLRFMLELYMMTGEKIDRIADFTLESALAVTSSPMGYIALVGNEQEGTVTAWSKCVLKECQAGIWPADDDLKSSQWWEEALKHGRPVIRNDFPDTASLIGGNGPRSEDHSPILRSLDVPVTEGERVVAVAGVVNKDNDYDEADVRQLTLLMNGFWGIVQRKNAEGQRRRLQQMMRDIFDYMPSMLCAVDDRGIVTQWNLQAEIDTGIGRERAIGDCLESIMQDWPVAVSMVRRCLAQPQMYRDEMNLVSSGPGIRRFEVTAYPLREESGNGAVLRVDDVSDKVRMQEVMIQTEKILSVGGIAAGMAHEINNPLGGIIQGIQNIQRRLDPGLVKNRTVAEGIGLDLHKVNQYLERRQILEFMDGIRDSGTRAARIVGNMLQFSRQSGSTKKPHRLETLLEHAIDLASGDYDLRKRYDFRHIEITREYDSALPEVMCHETEIEQVALNILKNAAQALKSDQAYLQSPQIRVRTYRDGEMAAFEISDNGPGMDEATRRMVFEPFFTTKPAGEGTGLGLSVSYFIIASNHKGQMYVESSPGRGTTFIVKLPLDDRS